MGFGHAQPEIMTGIFSAHILQMVLGFRQQGDLGLNPRNIVVLQCRTQIPEHIEDTYGRSTAGVVDLENLMEDWRESLNLLPEDSEDTEEYQDKIDDYEEVLGNLEEVKGIVDDIVLET